MPAMITVMRTADFISAAIPAAAAADADGAFLVVGGGDLLGDAAVDGGNGADGQLRAGFGAKKAGHEPDTLCRDCRKKTISDVFAHTFGVIEE